MTRYLRLGMVGLSYNYPIPILGTSLGFENMLKFSYLNFYKKKLAIGVYYSTSPQHASRIICFFFFNQDWKSSIRFFEITSTIQHLWKYISWASPAFLQPNFITRITRVNFDSNSNKATKMPPTIAQHGFGSKIKRTSRKRPQEQSLSPPTTPLTLVIYSM